MSKTTYTPEEVEAIAAPAAEEMAEEFAEQMQQKLTTSTGQGLTSGMATYQEEKREAELEEKLKQAEERLAQVEEEMVAQEDASKEQEGELEQLNQQEPEANAGTMGASTAPENTAIPTLKPPKEKPEDARGS